MLHVFVSSETSSLSILKGQSAGSACCLQMGGGHPFPLEGWAPWEPAQGLLSLPLGLSRQKALCAGAAPAPRSDMNQSPHPSHPGPTAQAAHTAGADVTRSAAPFFA